jgi:hypothetical protein
VARAGPPVSGLRYSRLVRVLRWGDRAISRRRAGRVGREVAGPGELGIDVLPAPDVSALGAGRLGELLTLPERQRGQLCEALVIVRDIVRGKSVAHCSSSYQGYASLRRSMHFPGRRQHLPDGVYTGRAGHSCPTRG